ncbi:BED zinc finger [Abeliophyllum distichum]|uniref:BED zinc finger n=1 Tax=Abeliophyllum distichum TaxID=126358 RepID=A0ABD1V5T5_9LAMI
MAYNQSNDDFSGLSDIPIPEDIMDEFGSSADLIDLEDVQEDADTKLSALTLNENSPNKSLEQILCSMYEVYVEKVRTNVVQPPVPTCTSSSTDNIDLWSYISTYKSGQGQQSVGSSSSSFLLRSNDTPIELVRYFAHDVLSMLDDKERNFFDMLRWWRQHQRSYPILSKIARDLLTLQVSTVASKAAFSTSGRILSDIMSRLKTDILESLLCLKNWDDAELRIQDKVDRIISEELEDLNMD